MNSSKERFRTRLTTLVVIALAGGGVGLWAHIREAHAGGHSHGHDDHEASALTLNAGQGWDTDAALRTGMQRIRDAAGRVLAAPAAGPISKDDAKQFSTTVQESVEYLVKNCKLEPKADAALHVLITDLMTGAASLVENPASAEAVGSIRRALERYPEHFDHPGWKSVTTAEPQA